MCLKFFAKGNPAYGGNIKLYSEGEVEELRTKKEKYLAGEGEEIKKE